jgi:hypothetical protein
LGELWELDFPGFDVLLIKLPDTQDVDDFLLIQRAMRAAYGFV